MKRIFLTIGLVFLLTATAQAQMTRAQAATDFGKANLAYKNAQYDEAIAAYENIVKSGWESGALYYNLANGYVKKSLWGRAILNYERARLLIPRDVDLKSNYDFALSQCKASLMDSRGWVESQFEKFLEFYTLNELLIILSLLVGLCMIIHLLSLYGNWTDSRRVTTLIILGILVIVYSAGIVVKSNTIYKDSIVIADSPAKFEPRAEATTYFDLYQGEKVRVTVRQDGWAKIQRMDQRNGWIKSENIEDIHQSSKKAGK